MTERYLHVDEAGTAAAGDRPPPPRRRRAPERGRRTPTRVGAERRVDPAEKR